MRNGTNGFRSNLNVVRVSYFLIGAKTILIHLTCKYKIIETCSTQTINMDLLRLIAGFNNYTIMLNLPVSYFMAWVYISNSKFLIRLDDRFVSLDFIAVIVSIKDIMLLCAPCYVALLLHIKRYGRNTELNSALTLEINRNRVIHTCPRGCNTH